MLCVCGAARDIFNGPKSASNATSVFFSLIAVRAFIKGDPVQGPSLSPLYLAAISSPPEVEGTKPPARRSVRYYLTLRFCLSSSSFLGAIGPESPPRPRSSARMALGAVLLSTRKCGNRCRYGMDNCCWTWGGAEKNFCPVALIDSMVKT